MKLYFLIVTLFFLSACGKTQPKDKLEDKVKIEAEATQQSETQSPVQSVVNIPTAHEYRAYQGNLDENLPFNMHLVWDEGEVHGWYDYKRFGRPIELQSKRLDDGRLMLFEIDPQTIESGKNNFFLGNFTTNKVSGKWENADGNTTFQFEIIQNVSDKIAHPKLKSIHKIFGDCEKDSCLEISLTYPILDKKWGKMFNDSMYVLIKQQLESNAEDLAKAVQETGDSFLEILKDDDAGFVHWATNVSTEILYNANGIFSVRMNMYSYAGGAHGQPYSVYLTYDLHKKRFIKLSDLFEPGYEEPLRQQLIRALKLQYGKSASATFESLGYYVTESEFKVNRNFFVCLAGIGFQYTPYEIGPYAIGFQEAFVPFKAMGDFFND